jgi:hypothetical protein
MLGERKETGNNQNHTDESTSEDHEAGTEDEFPF